MIYLTDLYPNKIDCLKLERLGGEYVSALVNSTPRSFQNTIGNFDGSLADLAILDSYAAEFPTETFSFDNGVSVANYFAYILVRKCGFTLYTGLTSSVAIPDCVLFSDEANALVFPWQQIWQSIESRTGVRPLASAWCYIVRQQNESNQHLPASWHPLIDMSYNPDGFWPERIAMAATRVMNECDYLLSSTLLDTLGWSRKTPLTLVSDRFSSVLPQ